LPEFTFFNAPVAVGVTQGAVNGLGRGSEQATLAAAEALGQAQYFVSSAACFEAAGGTRHTFLRSFNEDSETGGRTGVFRQTFNGS
jgi:hypothetical protein